MSLLLSFITGGALKIIAGIVSGYLQQRREEKLLLLNADVARMRALYGGELKVSKFRDWTRRFLAIMITGTMCFLVAYVVMFKSDLISTIQVPKTTSWIIKILWGGTDSGTLTVSVTSLLLIHFPQLVSGICGFYFTKILDEKA
uniref:Uncharacterized protein n=1 Tax=viral metagenome TaxID=1070528 RepID=A0A6M3JKH3_9ZZZZ